VSAELNQNVAQQAQAHFALGVRPRIDPRSVMRTACGKAIIVGEHAVVYGARAVAMPVPSLMMSLTLKPTFRTTAAGDPEIRIFLGGRAVTEHLEGVVQEALELLGTPAFGMDLEGQSTVLIGAGLGSSASLCIVILKALAAARGQVLSAEQLAAFGNRLERRFHGNPSGLDTAVVACEQVISFRKGQAPVTVSPSSEAGPWRFALLDTGVRSSTLEMIQVAAPYFQGEAGARRVERFNQLADLAVTGLTLGRPTAVAKAMSEAATYLTEAGVVNTPVQELIDLARAAGAQAAKPTGAGGGGCVLALLANDTVQADRQLAALAQKVGGGRVYGVEFA
jgi:mevalonate kinase